MSVFLPGFDLVLKWRRKIAFGVHFNILDHNCLVETSRRGLLRDELLHSHVVLEIG